MNVEDDLTNNYCKYYPKVNKTLSELIQNVLDKQNNKTNDISRPMYCYCE
jgi:hypothetical protein